MRSDVWCMWINLSHSLGVFSLIVYGIGLKMLNSFFIMAGIQYVVR